LGNHSILSFCERELFSAKVSQVGKKVKSTFGGTLRLTIVRKGLLIS